MPRPKGSTNKITADVKEQLRNLIDEVINSIDVSVMDTNQKLKLLQLSLHYIIPKLRSVEHQKAEDDQELPFLIDIHKRDDNGEWVHEYIEKKLPASLMKNNQDKWTS
jgi:uncharacterized coiled-coil protein SlyX